MIADMHCHFPMQLAAREPKRQLRGRKEVLAYDAASKVFSNRPQWVDSLRALVIKLLGGKINYRDDRWRVDLAKLEQGDVRAVFSVLYEPFAEFDLDEPYGAKPESGYFGDLLRRLREVEKELERIDPRRERAELVATAADLDRVTAAGKVAFMHCVEGGFHLGREPDEIKDNVANLKQRGVVYITLAHLFFRGIATNAPAIPFLSDRLYRRIFAQPSWGLSALGRAAIEAMYEQGMLIDLSHMSEAALAETFLLLDELDRASGAAPRDHPVIVSHAGYRFGKQEYMLGSRTIQEVARRDGVIGLILARHQLNECAGVGDPDDPAETVPLLQRHIDAIRSHVPDRSNAHVAIGSDLDGFIKPTVAGIETAADLATLAGPLTEIYGAEAEMILSGNAMRVARQALG